MFTRAIYVSLLCALGFTALTACGGGDPPPPTPSPSITTFRPQSGVPGSAVIIEGNNFGDKTQVRVMFDGKTAELNSANSTKIEFVVPATSDGPHLFKVEMGGRISATETFQVNVTPTTTTPPVNPTVPKPSISSITPQSGFVDTDVTIQGLNFGSDQSKVSVEISGQLATIKSFGATSVTFTIPPGLNQGSYSVKLSVDGQVVTKQFNVTVPVPPAVGVSVSTTGNVTQTTPGGKITLNATVTGSTSGVIWSIIGADASALSSTSGLSIVFTAGAVTGVATVEVKATLATDSSKSYPFNLTVNPIVQPQATVTAGFDHVLAIKADGSLEAWGHNGAGQLGDGTNISRSSPVQISGLSGISSISAANHTMAVKDGNVWTWGWNDYGQLGDGTKTSRSQPATVSGLSNMVSVAAGHVFSVALKADGTVWTWGTSADGRLGRPTPTTDIYPTPGQVPTLSNVIAISAGYHHALALKNDGSLWAWGLNLNGQIGDGTVGMSNLKQTPVKVLDDVAAMTAGEASSLAIKHDGSLWAWGDNRYGQLGDGTFSSSYAPKRIMFGVRSVSLRTFTTLIVKADNSLWACGWNGYGQIGDNSKTDVSTPTKVLENIALPVAASPFSAALKTDGTILTWGNNSFGTLGDGASIFKNTPALVAAANGNRFTAITAGQQTGFGLRADGSVWGWGYSANGEVGDGGSGSGNLISAPRKVIASGITAISSFNNHALALKSNGDVLAWGANSHGQLGTGDRFNRTVPTLINGLSGVKAISTGSLVSLALKTNGDLWGWGDNYFGQAAGRSTTASDPTDTTDVSNPQSILRPVLVMTGVSFMATGEAATYVYKTDGTTQSWGYNDAYDGRLGTGNGNGFKTPTTLPGFTNLSAFASGFGHAYALKNDGTIWGWGNRGDCSAYPACNIYAFNRGLGYYADGDAYNTIFAPAKLVASSLQNISQIASGWKHTLALSQSGTVWAWGLNSEVIGGQVQDHTGRIGNGTMDPIVYYPNQVNFPSGISIVKIAAGSTTSLAISSTGDLYAWGSDMFGQLGLGRSLARIQAPTSSNLTGYKLPN
jgi:alpha-tubulin suppressor-like RCC1 family protein